MVLSDDAAQDGAGTARNYVLERWALGLGSKRRRKDRREGCSWEVARTGLICLDGASVWEWEYDGQVCVWRCRWCLWMSGVEYVGFVC